MKRITGLFATVGMLCLFLASPLMADEDGFEIKKLALQVSDNNPGTMNKVLNVAANFARGMSEAGHEYEIEIVAYNAGLHMLREDTSPVKERVANFPTSIPNVTFSACGNTIAGMTRNEGEVPPIMEFANHVPAGVMRLMDLDDQGYFVMRP
ncbi:hypothetical protein SAMN04490248_104115 [Salinihabitans flavidus]|uniref:Intracellular sulfur oxidation protein, DsrE/DsrF family n=1 Tax=Salinihabitans flavidus TaxID=569882 RepID=A0A1H8P3E7_9RHOB|nr:hypothetical protein [Salinihabitans flavidus]SEO36138.1 hypothetical protein SAMN04490248_104115 [Salinihabitans flavidus]